MKNSLLYYFNININDLRKIKDNYYFSNGNNNFIVALYNRSLEEISSIYSLNKEMLQYGIPVFEIIPTNTYNILFLFEDNLYLLMKYPNIKNRLINYADILRFNYFPKIQNFDILDKSNWGKSWENKVDYYEKESSEIKEKYSVIKNSINYFIGLAENGISYFNDNFDLTSLEKVVSHIRVGINTDLYEFFNPLNLIIDYKERDVSEYLKSYVIHENYTESKIIDMIKMKNDNRNSVILLISRMLFPTYYFDEYDNVILKNFSFIDEIIQKRKNINLLIKLIFQKYYYLNIPYIDWILKES